ncbi:MAG: radical SAM protein [Limnochordia bacterium]
MDKPLYAYVLEKYRQRNIPLTAVFELTYGCNLNCIHCYNPTRSQTRDLSLEEIADAAEQMRRMGIMDITLTGGELFYRRDWYEAAEIFSRIGFTITVFTNAVLIDDKVIARLTQIDPLLIEVSLYGSSPEYYERITRVKGSFARFVNGLELLKKSGLNFVLKPVVLRQNFQDYEAMLAFADSKGYRLRFRFSPCLLPSGRHRNDFRLSDGEMVELFRHAPEQAEAVFAKCGIGQGGLVVGPTGDIRPCVAYPTAAGNIREQTLEVIWQESPLFKELRDISMDELENCRLCNLKQYCEPCLALNLLETGDLLKPSENCRIAANRKLAKGGVLDEKQSQPRVH